MTLTFGAQSATLAARGSTWGGMLVGLIALGIFVIFSGWIVAQRIKTNRKDRAADD